MARLSAVSVAELLAAAADRRWPISRRQLWMFVRRGRPRHQSGAACRSRDSRMAAAAGGRSVSTRVVSATNCGQMLRQRND